MGHPELTDHPIDREERREVLAYLEGHDADIPTDDQTPRGHTSTSTTSATEVDVKKNKDLELGRRPSFTDDVKTEEYEPVAETEDVDPNLVWWDGPEDVENPVNWSEGLKSGNVALISLITFITYVLSTPQSPPV